MVKPEMMDVRAARINPTFLITTYGFNDPNSVIQDRYIGTQNPTLVHARLTAAIRRRQTVRFKLAKRRSNQSRGAKTKARSKLLTLA